MGSAVVLTRLYGSARKNAARAGKTSFHAAETGTTRQTKPAIDMRLILLGSLLPDIIDKPSGQWLFEDTFSNGRIFSHTLLFLAVLVSTGIYLYLKQRRSWLLVLGLGTFAHLLLDEMWLTPRTLFWPFFGFDFPRVELTSWGTNILQALFNDPSVYVPELIGFIILACFFGNLVRKGRLVAFIKRGH